MAEEQSTVVHISLNKIKWKPISTETINKVEITQIDRYLTCEQRKQIAQFYRSEAAKRTRYIIEPTWTLPPSICATPKTQEPEILHQSSTTDNTARVEDQSDILELSTSPLPVANSEAASSSTDGEQEPENGMIKTVVSDLWSKDQGSYSTMKRNLFVVKDCLKGLEMVSRTQMKRKLYQERKKKIKELKQQHQKPR